MKRHEREYSTPPQCCRCNGKGRCVGCSCVRSGRMCTNCTPRHKGRCENLDGAPLCGTADVTPPANQPEPEPDPGSDPLGELWPMAEGTETSEEMTAGRLGGVWVADLDNCLHAMEFATRMPPIPISTVPSPRMGSARQEESPDISPEVETEDPNEMVDSSSLNSVKDIPSIPSFIPLCVPNFRWGEFSGSTISSKVDDAYEAAIHWKRNLFDVPKGKVGSEFSSELSRLLDAYSDATTLESIALKASMILPLLLLQRPHPKSKPMQRPHPMPDGQNG